MRRKEKPSSRVGKIAIIGGGRMAEALIKGLAKSKSNLMASDVQAIRREYLKKNCGIRVTQSNQEAADFGDIIILAVKPQAMKEAVKGLKIEKGKLIISIAAGVPLSYLQRIFKYNPVIRVMPNNPALIRAGISAIAYGSLIKEENKIRARNIFKSVGEVVEVSEDLMDAVTGLSGSGPAFVYLFIGAMVEAGESLGIKREIAYQLAVQTVLGSAKTLKMVKKSAQELIEMVASPGGTTLRGLNVLEERGFKSALMDAISAAASRAKELSQEWT